MGLFDSVNKPAQKPSGYSSDTNRTEEIVFEKVYLSTYAQHKNDAFFPDKADTSK